MVIRDLKITVNVLWIYILFHTLFVFVNVQITILQFGNDVISIFNKTLFLLTNVAPTVVNIVYVG